MKRFLIILIVCCLAPQLLPAEPSPPATSAPTASAPVHHRVGLIDMAHVFNNYDKFKAMKDALQAEVTESDDKARNMVEAIKQTQAQLTSGNLQEGSADFTRLEEQLLKSQTELETFRRVTQRDVLRKEADIYKTIYLEVQDVTNRYAEHFKYTLVLRFNRNEVSQQQDPREIIDGMNRQVVYFRAQDDITDPILRYLNHQWKERQASGTPKTSTK